MRPPLIVAHRGDSRHAPENTLAAFALAIRKGADVIELDVHAARDGALVVHHDSDLGRTCNGSGYIGDFTWAELRRLDAGSWFSPAFLGERIPMLDEVLELGRNSVRFEIELKATSRDFLNNVLRALAQHDLDVYEAVEITSPHIPVLIEIAKIEPRLRLGMFFGPRPDWMRLPAGQQQISNYLSLSRVQVAHLPVSWLNLEFIKQLHAHDFLVHAANLNSETEIEQGIGLNIDQFSTEHIELAVAKRRLDRDFGSA